jgi:hypothetical protein
MSAIDNEIDSELYRLADRTEHRRKPEFEPEVYVQYCDCPHAHG